MILYKHPHQDILLSHVTGKTYYLVWWLILDMYPRKIKMCELMASLMCDTSVLKATNIRLRGKTFRYKVCLKCDLGMTENVKCFTVVSEMKCTEN